MNKKIFTFMTLAAIMSESYAGTITEDFGKPKNGWRFNGGVEFPGASGTLKIFKDGDYCLKLSADFSKGGNYVGAAKSFSPPIAVSEVRFKIKTSAPWISLRMIDGTGQSHQQKLLLAGSDNEWQEITVKDFGGTFPGFVHWGGAKDGTFHQPLRSIMFVTRNLDVPGEKWDILIKQLVFTTAK